MRKKIVVDKKFQLKVSFGITGIILLLLAFIVFGIGVFAAYNNSQLSRMTYKMADTITDQDHIIDALNVNSNFDTVKKRRIASKIISSSLKTNSDIIKENMNELAVLISLAKKLMIFIIVFVVFQCIFFFYYVLRKTHSLSGPVHAMAEHIRGLLDGDSSGFREIRRKDEFRELAGLLSILTDQYISLKEKAEGNDTKK